MSTEIKDRVNRITLFVKSNETEIESPVVKLSNFLIITFQVLDK